ncbi:MAG: AAA family ATPase [Candidatus Eiseniibacteriota bacterium]
MSDQARELRALAASATPERAAIAEEASTPALVLGSGKGGVGKSALAVMFAAALSRLGLRVLLVDAAQNQGNLHVLLGVRPPARLDALLAGDLEPRQLVVPVAERLSLVPSDSGAQSTYHLSSLDRARLQDRLASLYPSYDHVVIDGGPGIEGAVRATLGASRIAIVTMPEPAALSDAYALIKIVHLQMPSVHTDVLVNRTQGEGECQAVFERLSLGAMKFLRRELHLLGEIPEDESLRPAVRETRGLLLLRECPAARAVAAIAQQLAAPANADVPAPLAPGGVCPA